MTKTILFCLALVALSVPARAQNTDPEVPVSWTVAIYQPVAIDAATAIPVRPAVTYVLGATGMTCGLLKVPDPGGNMPVNPGFVRMDDPADATKDCRANVTTQIMALPIGTYKAAAIANGATQQSAWSAFSNQFQRATTAPATPTGVRAIKQ